MLSIFAAAHYVFESYQSFNVDKSMLKKLYGEIPEEKETEDADLMAEKSY